MRSVTLNNIRMVILNLQLRNGIFTSPFELLSATARSVPFFRRNCLSYSLLYSYSIFHLVREQYLVSGTFFMPLTLNL